MRPQHPLSQHPDDDWAITVDEQPNGTVQVTHDRIALFLLGDIRRELQTLNRLLGCQNFTTLPREIRGLRRDVKALTTAILQKETTR